METETESLPKTSDEFFTALEAYRTETGHWIEPDYFAAKLLGTVASASCVGWITGIGGYTTYSEPNGRPCLAYHTGIVATWLGRQNELWSARAAK